CLSLPQPPPPPPPTLFPYTTLFRSVPEGVVPKLVDLARRRPGLRRGRDAERADPHADLPELQRRTHETVFFALTSAVTVSFTGRSEEHTSELQSRGHLVCRLLLEKK